MSYKEVSGSWWEFVPGKLYTVVGHEGNSSQAMAGTGRNMKETSGMDRGRKTVAKLHLLNPVRVCGETQGHNLKPGN